MKTQEIKAITIIEIIFQFLSNLSESQKTLCHYDFISSVNAPAWWRAWIEVFNLNIKDLSSDELFNIANKICDYVVITDYIAKSTNTYSQEEYFRCLVLIIIKTEKLTLENIILLHNRIGNGEWDIDINKTKESILETKKGKNTSFDSREDGIGRH
jgi:hypothetical protein